MASKPSKNLQPTDAAIIKRRLLEGDYQHTIAADFRCNQGRISEINTGKRFKDVPPADKRAA